MTSELREGQPFSLDGVRGRVSRVEEDDSGYPATVYVTTASGHDLRIDSRPEWRGLCLITNEERT